MPAAEANAVDANPEMETTSYEFAFHVLPTVAEGEVSNVFEALKNNITNYGGEIFDEEAPERFDLAYEIVQHIEGKNRKFASTYFGWIRFKAPAASVEAITAEVEGRQDILRYLTVKLTKAEEAYPFRFHEALKDVKMVTTVEESAVVPEEASATKEDEADKKVAAEDVNEGELDKALDKEEETK